MGFVRPPSSKTSPLGVEVQSRWRMRLVFVVVCYSCYLVWSIPVLCVWRRAHPALPSEPLRERERWVGPLRRRSTSVESISGSSNPLRWGHLSDVLCGDIVVEVYVEGRFDEKVLEMVLVASRDIIESQVDWHDILRTGLSYPWRPGSWWYVWSTSSG